MGTEANRRLAAAAHRLLLAATATDAPPEVAEEAARVLDGVAAALETHGRRCVYDTGERRALDDLVAFYEDSPVFGASNPVAAPLRIGLEGDLVVAEGSFDQSHEGGPGRAHGGYIALTFDEVLSVAQLLSGSPGMTGTLTIRYRRPVPIGVPVRYEARFRGAEGRKLLTEGVLLVDGDVAVEADAVFISPRA